MATAGSLPADSVAGYGAPVPSEHVQNDFAYVEVKPEQHFPNGE
jgi:hypothetical protein